MYRIRLVWNAWIAWGQPFMLINMIISVWSKQTHENWRIVNSILPPLAAHQKAKSQEWGAQKRCWCLGGATVATCCNWWVAFGRQAPKKKVAIDFNLQILQLCEILGGVVWHVLVRCARTSAKLIETSAQFRHGVAPSYFQIRQVFCECRPGANTTTLDSAQCFLNVSSEQKASNVHDAFHMFLQVFPKSIHTHIIIFTWATTHIKFVHAGYGLIWSPFPQLLNLEKKRRTPQIFKAPVCRDMATKASTHLEHETSWQCPYSTLNVLNCNV